MNQIVPSLTPTVATQLETSIAFFSAEKQKALSLLPDNPYEVQSRCFGNLTVFLAQKTYKNNLFNRVSNIGEENLPYLDAIVDWHRTFGVSCCFEIVPLRSSHLLLWHLASRGLYQSGFYNVLYGLPVVDTVSFSNITVRTVLPEEKDLFADIYFESFEVPKTTEYSYVRDSIRVLTDIPTNECFFAIVKNKVVAIAVLSIYQHIGYLALAATLPSFRGYGCHKALLHTRIEKAAHKGCSLVIGQAGVGTVSQQNMEQWGLRLAYTKVEWTIYNPQQIPDRGLDPMNR
jgi:GNAT superfamily N-acetyltransferase